MDEANLEDKLRDIVKEFGWTPEPKLDKLSMLARQAQEGHERLEKSVNNLQESLDYLRVCVKYQLFDLEATRRENKYLRKLLEDRSD